MEYLNNLKAILHSKRANIFYLEKCRVLMKDGRVVYLTETKKKISILIFQLRIRRLFCSAWELR